MPEKTIITSESSNSSPLNPSSSRIICHVCNKQFSQYTCPRCNFRYCSLPCYKSHSVQCTESFMRENVNDELKQVRSDDQTKTKMLEILKRFHEEEEDGGIDSITDDDDEGSILQEEIMQRIMNGDEVSLDDLSLEERKGFQRALASGELSKMIEPWDPWWLRASARTISLGRGGTQLVQCVEEEEEEEVRVVSEIPRGPDTPLISVSKLSATNPSPLLPIHLIDIVYSYCFTLRIYNGEWQSDSLGSATMVLSVSSVLGQNAQPETIKEVLSFCLEQTCSSAYKNLGGGLKFGLNLVDDVICLLSLGSGAIVCLLCDLQRLIHGAIREVKSSSGRDLKKRLKLAERKVFFMMCWVNEQSSEVWQALESSVRAEKNSVVELNGVPKMKKTDQFRKGGGVVIEEIE
ncbi:PREDICTED: zinc finger HIT domain-containing protein 2-like [Camelina sativa]|uniref:Zinc finger HIT domain-containing protein 2-like n=1 Tax=Camelina sativa TaxID=90675 RepID=A0ABM0UPV1_CAMSA|nr:PREDICTED: zinc finger HIT domain-containing protein 2-like [Camelina sativa]